MLQESGEVVQVLQADEDVANCVQPHPSLPMLATSGIEPVIRCAACVICSCRRFYIFKNACTRLQLESPCGRSH